MMTNEQLAEEVARVKELHITPAMWDAWCGLDLTAIIAQLWDEREQLTQHGALCNEEIEGQDAIIQQQREVMRQVRDQLNLCRPEHVTRPLIAALDAALGGE